MGVEIFLGEPPENIKNWILEHSTPPGPTIIAQTSDGQVKVFSVTDNGQSDTFTYGHTWTVIGEGFTQSANEWFVEVAMIYPGGDVNQIMPEYNVISDTEIQIIAEASYGDPPAAGDYPNANLAIGMARNAEEFITEGFDIPIHFIVNN